MMFFKNRDLLVPKSIKKVKKLLNCYLKKNFCKSDLKNFIDPKFKVLIFAILFNYFFLKQSLSIENIFDSFLNKKMIEKYLKKDSSDSLYKSYISFKKPSILSAEKFQIIQSKLSFSSELVDSFTLITKKVNSNDLVKIFEYAIYLFLVNYNFPKFSLLASKNLKDSNYELKINDTKEFCNQIAKWFLLIRNYSSQNCNNIIRTINFLLEKMY